VTFVTFVVKAVFVPFTTRILLPPPPRSFRRLLLHLRQPGGAIVEQFEERFEQAGRGRRNGWRATGRSTW
jgi:hypothetical protein